MSEVKERRKIGEIRVGMRKTALQGRIVDMNPFMIVLEDETGRIFVRYRTRNVIDPIATGDYVDIQNCTVVNYSGILQVRVEPSGRITPIKGPQTRMRARKKRSGPVRS